MNFIDNRSVLTSIGYTTKLLKEQKEAIKKAQHIESLLQNELFTLVKSNQSRFDYINLPEIATEAMKEYYDEKDTTKAHFEMLNEFLFEDFIGPGLKFKLTKIGRVGYDPYLFDFMIEGYEKTFRITIPYLQNIDSHNFECANEGQYVLSVQTNENAWLRLVQSYDPALIKQELKDASSKSLKTIKKEKGFKR